ncbi:MAG: hypothetical protein QM778_11710 [Myxococcales bacterium]
MPSQVQRLESPPEESARRERSERTYAVLIRGRERVRDVLEPHLGASCALERANNIAQALVFEDVEPRLVALEMLRQVPRELRSNLAEQVTRAWLDEPSAN